MANSNITVALLQWYDANHRIFPWRVSPADRARGVAPLPYHVWLSEIMLQQTTVQAVRPYFLAFVERWPDVHALAAADNEDVMKAWAGLGYYSRARNLKKCAEQIVSDHNGYFPDNVADLKALPGIGDYTAAAIAAIAFNRPAAVVDGNIERVVARLFAISTPLPAAKAPIREQMSRLTPQDRPGDFAQAMMDLGAIICTPKRPACGLCPLNADCAVAGRDDAEAFPVKPAKAKRPVRRGTAFVAVASDGSILLRKRAESGLLGGMTEVPGSAWTARKDGELGAQAAPFDGDWKEAGTIRHIFTHFELRLDVYRADFTDRPPLEGGWWSAQATLSGEALPTVMKKAIAAAIETAPETNLSRKGLLL
ncbi:A/G-specific adenine glycosylase [Hoeflea poritis]|uniref:Adenine DNA glycosylase n=1 Tax=Hoeflea poritis TaxID=2993659 RepID=A0ABT4VJC0_9HYPH|nr:A/G-specific adenine glycosylase [Hoeflea poritis]MDA4844799.1 A/G-specific adenine glycosylase [Hoeflea poritis]